MGILSRIFRRKKKEEEEKDLELKEETSPPPTEYPGPAYPQRGAQQQPVMPAYPEGDDREFQVLLSKLDALNTKLEMINQRLINLEKLAGQGSEEKQKW